METYLRIIIGYVSIKKKICVENTDASSPLPSIIGLHNPACFFICSAHLSQGHGVLLYCIIYFSIEKFCHVGYNAVQYGEPDVSEEHIASIFRF
jgi:hypothetical protein